MLSVKVYNPHDSLSTFTYMGTDFSIEPNMVTEITSPTKSPVPPPPGVIEVPPHLAKQGVTPGVLAAHAISTVGKWGVVQLSGNDGKDKVLIEAAEQVYVKAMREWCEDKVVAYETKMEPRRKAGLRDSDPHPDVVKARRWLEKRNLVKK
jgi:hypothetical protein